jgi:hypothetical protein
VQGVPPQGGYGLSAAPEKLRRYEVAVYFTGYRVVLVEAENEDDAIGRALDAIDLSDVGMDIDRVAEVEESEL